MINNDCNQFVAQKSRSKLIHRDLWCAISCLTLYRPSVESALSSPVVFGTRNGYDVDGGTDPICWESSVSPRPQLGPNETLALFGSPRVRNTSSVQTIDTIQSNLFGNGSSQAELLEACFNGTKMNIEAIQWPRNNTLFVGIGATVQLNLQVDPSRIIPLRNDTKLQTITNETEVWVRLFLCDATKIGFCNPFLNTVSIDMRASKNVTDASLPPGHAVENNIPNPNDPYSYEEGNVLIGLEDQAHIFTRWVSLTLLEVKGTHLFNASLDITFRTATNSTQHGPFFFIGHAVVFLPAEQGGRGTRVDVAAAIPNKIVSIQPPPHILEVTKKFKIGLGIAIGVFASIELAMFCAIIYHRNHPVMTLSQGIFLAWLVAASFVSIVSCFLLLPTHDIFCRLRGPLVLIPISMVASILVARIWRVYSTLSVALSFASGTKRGPKIYFPIAVLNLLAEGTVLGSRETPRGGKRQSLRQKITTRTTAKLILLLTLPQILLQLLDAVLYNKTVVEELDQAELIGRMTCAGGREWTVYVGVCLIAFVYIWGVYTAWVARDLPMLFNEKDCVFHAASINSVVVLIVIALVFITDKSTTSPDITVFLWATFAIVVSASASWFIVAPKLQRIWSQEKVVLSSLLRNPHRTSVVESHWQGGGSTDSSDQLTKSQDRTPHNLQDDSLSGERLPIILRKDEALPRTVETKVFALDKLIRHVTQECLEGRPISLSDWRDLMSLIESLNGEMERIEFDWTEGETDDGSEEKTSAVEVEQREQSNSEIVSKSVANRNCATLQMSYEQSGSTAPIS